MFTPALVKFLVTRNSMKHGVKMTSSSSSSSSSNTIQSLYKKSYNNCYYHTKVIQIQNNKHQIIPNHRMMLSCVRHAVSTFNEHPSVRGQIDGYFHAVTEIDSDLSAKGISQAKILCEKIHKKNNYNYSYNYNYNNCSTYQQDRSILLYNNGYNYYSSKHYNNNTNKNSNNKNKNNNNNNNDERLDLTKAQLVITSPLSRAIRTGLIAMPIERGYSYTVRWEITEQIENTSDIGQRPQELITKFPELKHTLSELPPSWWWRHPLLHKEDAHPQRDADWLKQCQGYPPARESDENVKNRVKHFLNWLIPQQNHKAKPIKNVVMFSHSCTLKFLEQILNEFYQSILSDRSIAYTPVYYTNTEVRGYEMPTPEEWNQYLKIYPLSYNNFL